MNDVLVSDTVDDRNLRLKNLSCASLVACLNCLTHGLNGGTQRRALAGIVRVLLDGLPGALACLCGICHGLFLIVARTQWPRRISKNEDYNKAIQIRANSDEAMSTSDSGPAGRRIFKMKTLASTQILCRYNQPP